jgi:hypothetical protein
MSALAALQARFLAAVIDGKDGAADDIRSTPGFHAGQRMAVYANAYRRRLVEALASVFERCAQRLGEDRFDTLGLAYVEAHSPVDRSLGRYGLDFPAWLQANAAALVDLGALSARTLAGVATIDAGLRRAFDAADAEPIGRDPLLGLPMDAWPRLRLVPVPAFATSRVDAAAIALWREPDALPASTGEDTTVAFWRRDGQTFFRSVAAPEALLLARLRGGLTLAEACTGDGDGDAIAIPLEVAAPALLSWVDEGWIAIGRCGAIKGA